MDATTEQTLRLLRDAATPDDAARVVVDRLAELPDYGWVGIYWVEGTDLVLGPWNGPQATEHTRIPIGQGICGAAAASGETEIIDDVSTDDRYLACFIGTKSEIVVPIRTPDGQIIGEIDVDGDRIGAFDRTDGANLEALADALGQLAATTRRPVAS